MTIKRYLDSINYNKSFDINFISIWFIVYKIFTFLLFGTNYKIGKLIVTKISLLKSKIANLRKIINQSINRLNNNDVKYIYKENNNNNI